MSCRSRFSHGAACLEADASETVFTEGADHSLTQALAGGGTGTWYDDGTRR